MAERVSAVEVAKMQRLRHVQELRPFEIALRTGRSRTAVRRALSLHPDDVATRRPPPSVDVPNARRAELAALHAALVSGELELEDVLAPVHPRVAGLPLLHVIMMTRAGSDRQNASGIEELGRDALRDGVNVLVRTDRASAATRAWAAERGRKHARGALRRAREAA